MGFIQAKTNPRFLPKCCSKKSERTPPKKWRKIANKKGRKSRNAQTWWTHGRAGTHGHPCTGVRVTVHKRTRLAVRWWCRFFRFLPGVHDRAPLWHARALPCFPLLCYSWCSGLSQTYNLSWNRSWSLLLYRNLMISPEVKNKCILGTIKSEGR